MQTFRQYLLEYSRGKSAIIVDIQPAYESHFRSKVNVDELARYLMQMTGDVLLFVNADDQGMTEDSKQTVYDWYSELLMENGADIDEIDRFFSRVTYFDKGYGYFRDWMDQGVDHKIIIKTIREMYRQKVTDSRELFGGDDAPDYEEKMDKLTNGHYSKGLDAIHTEWLPVNVLKNFNGSYIMGGAKGECLTEVQLYMSAFNIKAKEISKFIY